jgi:branched-chain amino acid transport system substrate-binding protein
MLLIDNASTKAAVEGVGRPFFVKAGVDLKVTAVPLGTADATPQVQAALSNNPDAVLITGDPTVCQAVLAGLQTSGSSLPKLGITTCIAKSVGNALGASAMKGLVIFDLGTSNSQSDEAKLYRAIMNEYFPKDDPGGDTATGYISMMGFIRAVNASGLHGGDPTPKNVDAAIQVAKDVPYPLGNGNKFSCDRSAVGTAIIKSVVCNSILFTVAVEGTTPGKVYNPVDAGALFK